MDQVRATLGAINAILKLLTGVPFKVRNCALPPDHLRSEISISCT